MSATRAVSMSFVAIGLLVWIVIAEFYGWVLSFFGPTVDRALIGVGFAVSDLLGIVTGIVVGIVMWKHEQINTIAHEIANELKKVVWPSWDETRGATVVVIIVTIVCALILGGYDAVWSTLTALIYEA